VRISCSWLALRCSLRFALSRAIVSRPVLSCSISFLALARSREIDWSNDASSGETPAGRAGAAGCEGTVFAASRDDPSQVKAPAPTPAASRMPAKPRSAHVLNERGLPDSAGRSALVLEVSRSSGLAGLLDGLNSGGLPFRPQASRASLPRLLDAPRRSFRSRRVRPIAHSVFHLVKSQARLMLPFRKFLLEFGWPAGGSRKPSQHVRRPATTSWGSASK
jgi:hypothetical protein